MLQLFTVFHLNLAYSSIDEVQRPDVLKSCYWPLLRLAERHDVAIGIEASAWTLQQIASLDAEYLLTLRRLVAGGKCEFIGSGYVQLIGPLVPADVNAANLRLGNVAYQRLLGFRPTIALVNEQAYAAGLVQHYLDAGYEAIIMEWENPARYRPDWDPEWRYFPQLACGHHGEAIPVIWNKAIAFQHLQRYAHGETELSEYLEYLGSHDGVTPRSFPLYGNDIEIFDFRPGRYSTEPALAEDGEWARIERLIEAIQRDPRFALVKPSAVLSQIRSVDGGHRLHLESAAQPTPVKKQRKYNITRWAVTGRDDLGINTACWRLWHALRRRAEAADDDWRLLCELWASDYRTHITDDRWEAVQRQLAEAGRAWNGAAVDSPTPARIAGDQSAPPRVDRDGPRLTIQTPRLTLTLNCRRGLAIESVCFPALGASRVFGTIAHGFYDDIGWGEDFFSGLLTVEMPGRPELTDLVAVEPTVAIEGDGSAVIEAAVPTDLGTVIKRLRVAPNGTLGLEYRFDWPEIPIGSLRLGDIVLDPKTFDQRTLFYRTHNGGRELETFNLNGTVVDHSEAVSFLVSASHAIGITEGVVEIGDRQRALRIEVDKISAALVGMVTFQPVRDSYFCRLSFSAAEVDETRRVSKRAEPLTCRFVISAFRP